MLLRPVDASGDLLPVMSSSDLLSGPEAVARLVQYRLSLLRRAWRENPENARFTVSGFAHILHFAEAQSIGIAAWLNPGIPDHRGFQ